MNKPLVLGITGGMGSGKTTAARYFESQFGIPVFYADDEAKKLYDLPEVRRAIENTVGKDVYDANGKPDFRLIASRIFKDEQMLRRVENILHPKVKEAFAKWKSGQCMPYVILENAILFETGMDALCDAVLFIKAGEQERIERIQKRDGFSEQAVRDRLKYQNRIIPDREKIKFIVENSGNVKDLYSELNKIHWIVLNK